MLMKSPRFSHFIAGAITTAIVASSFATAQLSVEKVAATNKILQQIKASIAKLPPSHQKMLDGYANIGRLADTWQAHGMSLADPSFMARAQMARSANSSNFAPLPAGIVRASNPYSDVAYSSFGGFTQSETSTARCGNTVVVGYNDSGSIFETPYYYTGVGGQGLSGSAYSTDGGASFKDIGPINPGSNTYNFMGGDPMINCADANTFYYTQIFDFYDSSFNPWAAIAINNSTDGGQSWGAPIPAIAKSAYYHLLDKPWST